MGVWAGCQAPSLGPVGTAVCPLCLCTRVAVGGASEPGWLPAPYLQFEGAIRAPCWQACPLLGRWVPGLEPRWARLMPSRGVHPAFTLPAAFLVEKGFRQSVGGRERRPCQKPRCPFRSARGAWLCTVRLLEVAVGMGSPRWLVSCLGASTPKGAAKGRC